MALFNPNDLKAWRYIVDSCIFLINGEAISLDQRCITGIEIHNNYMKDVFPIFKINFMLESSVYYKVLNNKTNLKLKLKIQKYNKNYNGSERSLRKNYINDTFITIDDTDDVDREVDLDLLEKIRGASSDNEMNKYDTSLELYFYREETATGVKKQLNDILQNVNMSSILGYLFGESGIKNALVSPLENNKTYKVMHLPPLTINKMIAHLDAAYGFYKAGSMIFFGLDRTYILNFKGGCTAFERNEKKETCVFIPKTTSVQNASGGTIETDPNKHCINWLYDQVNFQNASVSSDVIKGSDALVVKPSTAGKTKSSSKTTTNGNSNTAIIDDEAENPWLDTTFTAQSTANSLIIYGAMADIDVDALTPNKKFTLIFEDQALTNKYKGTYFLGKTMFKFVNDTAKGDFSIVASVEFRRVQQTNSSDA